MKLQNVLVAIAFSLFTAAVPAAEADPPAVIGRLNHVAGPVSFAPAQAPEDWAAATVNRPITTGDRLWTDSSGRAEMHVGSLAIRMDAQTSLDVLRLDDRGLQLRLAQGSANLRLRRGASDQPVEIATPGGAVVLSRPGSYRVSVDPTGSATSLTVRRGGEAEVFAPNGSFVVSDGQQALFGGPRQDLAVAPAPDDFDRWAATRDQREDRVASTRYVPAEMTGYEDLDEYGTWRTVPEYGTVWRPRAVPAGWAPYRHGHWVWVAPWGWTWVDDAPWGFAPSHYGRWVWLGNHWAWAPGRIVARPVYAPAMVAFIGGSNFSVSVGVGSAPAVAWVPLGWREPYRPWYRASNNHVRNVNITHVTNVNITNNVTNVRLVNRNAPSAVTVVSRENFVAARAVQPAALRVSSRTIAAAPVTKGAPVAAPERASLAVARSGSRPPSEVRSRETVAVNTPPAPARDVERAERKGKGRDEARIASRGSDDHPRVRVIDRQQRVQLQAAQAPASSAAQPQTNAIERAPERAAPQPQGKAPAIEAKGNERAQERAASRPQPAPQAERRVPAPPADTAKRPTFDREMRQVAPQAEGEQRARERQGREQQPTQEQRAREQQEGRQRQAQQQERQRQQEAKERQDRRHAETQRQLEQRQEERRQRAQPEPEQAQRQQAQPRAQEPATQQPARERASEQARQRSQEQAQQRAQQQAREQAQRQEQAQQQAQAQAQQQAQQRAQEQAQRQQQEHQRAREQAQQRAQQQAQQHQAREQQMQQRAEQQAREQARQQQQAQRAQQQGPQQQQDQARQQRRDQSQEKGGRERARQDKDKSEKG